MVNSEFSRRFMALFAVLFFVPVLGWLTSLYVSHDLEQQFHAAVVPAMMPESDYVSQNLSYMTLCGPGGRLASDPETQSVCGDYKEIEWVQWLSIGVTFFGILILMLVFGARIAAGYDRQRLALLFGPVIRIVLCLLGLSMLVQSALFIYSIYTLETSLTHRFHGILLAGIALAAIVGCFQLLSLAFGLFKETPIMIRGVRLKEESAPELFNLVRTIAKKLKADSPTFIVAGLEPNFFVTANAVELIGPEHEVLRGQILFVSVSLLRLFSKDELAAVVGHELGHFRGGDAYYSKKFAPIYSRLSSALERLSESSHDSAQLAVLPAVITTGFMLNMFAEVERKIGRDRELLADIAGAEAAGPENLASALVKVATFSDIWAQLEKKHIDMLSKGTQFIAIPQTYRTMCDQFYSVMDWSLEWAAIAGYSQPHPFDTHPSTALRIEKLGIPAEKMNAECASPAENSASGLIAEIEELEKTLTGFEVYLLGATGAVVIPVTESS